MTALSYGQPLDGITQVAYIVEDIQDAMTSYSRLLRVGPWFVTGPFVPREGRYRGAPTAMQVTLAVAFSGHLMVELVQQHDELPSVYRETIERTGYGFHHYGVPVRDLEASIATYQELGYALAFRDVSPRGTRVAYMDCTRSVHGMIELIELTPRLEAIYTGFQRASIGWDGSDPVRRG